MIPVSSSKIIEFINWIKYKQSGEYLSRLNYYEILQLANDFLHETRMINFSITKRSDVLKLFMQLYQSLPQGSTEPLERMRQFTNWDFIKSVNMEKWITNVHKPVNPYLKKFITYSSKLGYKKYFEKSVYDLANNRSLFIPEVLYQIIYELGDSLVHVFEDYYRFSSESQVITFRVFIEEEVYNDQLGREFDGDMQADGLAQAVRELISGEFYDELIAKNESVSSFLYLIGGVSENIVQCLTFIEWFKRRYPDINLLGNIPAVKIEQWVEEFCISKRQNNIPEFTREIKKLTRGENSLSGRIKSYLKKRTPYLQERHDLFQRYDLVSMHGMFVFAPNHDIAKFIESNWKQFNYILGSNFDVYYSLDDFQGRTEHSFDHFSEFKINLVDLPAFIYWGDSLENHFVISFAGLEDHNDIAEVFEKVIVAGVRNNDTPSTIIKNTQLWKSHRIEQRKLEKIINSGGITMSVINGGQNFINNGYKMEIKDNYIIQENEKSEFKELDLDDISSLKNLIRALKNCDHEDLSEELALQGASIMSGLIKANEEKNMVLKSSKLIELKNWKEQVGEKGFKVLAIVADLTTLTIPVLHLLGITNI